MNLKETFSQLVAIFKLKRQLSYYITQFYIPCVLIVFLSWIGFYLDRDDIVNRVTISK
jgi:gamma-aminobutyric acid receptor subunit alpha